MLTCFINHKFSKQNKATQHTSIFKETSEPKHFLTGLHVYGFLFDTAKTLTAAVSRPRCPAARHVIKRKGLFGKIKNAFQKIWKISLPTLTTSPETTAKAQFWHTLPWQIVRGRIKCPKEKGGIIKIS